MNILEEIVAKKRLQLEEEMKTISIEGWKQKIKRSGVHRPLDFYKAIKNKPEISIIAEVKKASPSKGIIQENFNPLATAGEYIASQVDAISVLTEKNFFLGDDDYLMKVRQISPVPILRKDFIIDIWQIYQSRWMGADAILLITSILSDEELKKFRIIAGILGLHCIVEVHNREELSRALDAGAQIIGINNRDLTTFEVSLQTTSELINHIPANIAVISESGIKNEEDMKFLKACKVDAVLIGETLMRSSSIANEINMLRRGLA